MHITLDGKGLYKRVNSKGKLVTEFRYIVKGTPEELATYKASRGEFYAENAAGEPLFFSPNYVGKSAELTQSAKGQFYADNSELEIANNLATQFPALAGEFARDAVAKMRAGTSVSVAAPAVTETEGNDLDK